MIVDNIVRDLANKVASYRAGANNRDLENFSSFKSRIKDFFFDSFLLQAEKYFKDIAVRDMKDFAMERVVEGKVFYINFIPESELFRRNLPFFSISAMAVGSEGIESISLCFPAIGEVYSTNFSGGIILNNKRLTREPYKGNLFVSDRDFFSGSVCYDLAKLMVGQVDICDFAVGEAGIDLLASVLLALECGFVMVNANKKIVAVNDFLLQKRVIIGKGNAIDRYFNDNK